MAPHVQRILSLDPGGTTGWCVHNLGGNSFRGGQLEGSKHHKKLFGLLRRERPDVVVCEAFNYQIRKQSGVDMPGVVLMSREYIGVAELWSQLYNRQLVMQQPSIIGLQWLKNPALKRLGIYKSGEQHRNDATRHMLYYVVQNLGLREYLGALRN